MSVGQAFDEAVRAVWEQTERQTRRCVAVWYETSDERLDLGPGVGAREQREREAFLDARVNDLAAALGEMPGLSPAAGPDDAAIAAWQRRILAIIESLLREALGFGPELLDTVMRSGMADVGVEFCRAARYLDPSLDGASIFQAWRNAWVMNVLQLAVGLPVSLTPAIFAYSMLYPNSDNVLDDPRIGPDAKAEFNARLGRRLAGPGSVGAMAGDPRAAAIDALIGLIERQYPRDAYPRVYGALLAIHRAQCHSLALQRRGASPYQQDVIGLSVEKGGASVLADAYLVDGDVNEDQASFAFGLGAYLQLADDLQDVSSDRSDGLLTVFSMTARRWPLDPLVNRLLRLPDPLLASDPARTESGARVVQELLRRSSRALILGAVAENRRWFSRDYLRWLEAHASVRLSALYRLRRRVAAQARSVMLAMQRAQVPSLAAPPSPGSLLAALDASGVRRGATPH